MYFGTKTRGARSPWFQSIKKVIGFSLKLSDCNAKFGAAKFSLFSFHTLGGVFCFAFIIIIFFKSTFYFTIFCCLGASPPGKATAAGGDLLCGGLRDVLPGQGRPAPGLCSRAAPTPPSAARPARGNRSQGPQRRTAKKIYKQNSPPRTQRKNKKPPWKGNLKKRRK